MEIYDEFGNSGLIEHKKTAFLCSRNVPPEHHATILSWANNLSPDDCIISGFQSPLERQVGNILLQRGIPVIWVALNLEEVKSKMEKMRSFVMDQRILILVLFDNTCPLALAQQSYVRNHEVLNLSQDVVVGYCSPNGTLSRQLAGVNNYTQLVATNNHRYLDFLHLSNGFISLETTTDDNGEYLQLTQQRQTNECTYKDIIKVSATEVVRLRNILNQVIENNQWDESQYKNIREVYPNAYRKWTPDEILILRDLSQQGLSDMEISQVLGRQPSAIASRLQKLIDFETSLNDE